jgi:hypothetical protein
MKSDVYFYNLEDRGDILLRNIGLSPYNPETVPTTIYFILSDKFDYFSILVSHGGDQQDSDLAGCDVLNCLHLQGQRVSEATEHACVEAKL